MPFDLDNGSTGRALSDCPDYQDFRAELIRSGVISKPAAHDVEQQPRDYTLTAADDIAGKRERDPRVAYGYAAPPRRPRSRR
jgi:hypothetical protein